MRVQFPAGAQRTFLENAQQLTGFNIVTLAQLEHAIQDTARGHFLRRNLFKERCESTAESDGLLNRCTGSFPYRGFESLPLRCFLFCEVRVR